MIYQTRDVLSPFIFFFIIAYLLNPLWQNFLSDKKLKYLVYFASSFNNILFFAIVVLIGLFFTSSNLWTTAFIH